MHQNFTSNGQLILHSITLLHYSKKGTSKNSDTFQMFVADSRCILSHESHQTSSNCDLIATIKKMLTLDWFLSLLTTNNCVPTKTPCLLFVPAPTPAPLPLVRFVTWQKSLLSLVWWSVKDKQNSVGLGFIFHKRNESGVRTNNQNIQLEFLIYILIQCTRKVEWCVQTRSQACWF